MLRGYRSRARALELARTVNANPRLWELTDGSFVAVGETLLLRDGTRDCLLYGARGTTALASEQRARQGDSW